MGSMGSMGSMGGIGSIEKLSYQLDSLQDTCNLASELADSILGDISSIGSIRNLDDASVKVKTSDNQAICIFLDGPLGAGKTEWCRQIIGRLGYTGQVTSPTYGLIESYDIKLADSNSNKADINSWSKGKGKGKSKNKNKNSLVVQHIDAYRLHKAEELNQIGLEDYVSEAQLLLVEWGQERGCARILAPDINILIIPNPNTSGNSAASQAGIVDDNIMSERRRISIQANTPRGQLLLQSLKSPSLIYPRKFSK